MASESQASTQILLRTLEATAATYISVFATLDPTILTPILSSNFTQSFGPASVELPQSLNATDFCAHLRNLATLMRSFTVTPLQTWPNPTLRQVIIHADSQAEFLDEVRDGEAAEWEYRGEYIFVLSMSEMGDKVESVFEFLDSAGTQRLQGLMARARENRKRKEEVKIMGKNTLVKKVSEVEVAKECQHLMNC